MGRNENAERAASILGDVVKLHISEIELTHTELIAMAQVEATLAVAAELKLFRLGIRI